MVGLSPHLVIGMGPLAVSANSFLTFDNHAHCSNVHWRIAALFALVGMAGAAIGSNLGKPFDGQRLLFLFAILMIVVGIMMLRQGARPQVASTCAEETLTAPVIAKVAGATLLVGVLSGFFGIGGGFLVVPGLLFSTGMPMIFAVGSSLLAVGRFGLTTAVNYGWSGLGDWPVAAEYIVGGVAGGLFGMRLGNRLAPQRAVLNKFLAGLVFTVAIYMIYHNAGGLSVLRVEPDMTKSSSERASSAAEVARRGIGSLVVVLILAGGTAYQMAVQPDALLSTASASVLPREIAERIATDPAAHFAGSPAGSVTVVEFFDYRCPYFRTMQPTLEALIARDNRVRVLFKEWPIFDGASILASHVALASAWQGKFAAVHAALFSVPRTMDAASIRQVAAGAGIDLDRLDHDLTTRAAEIDAALARVNGEARAIGFEGRPAS